jgi:hypothetical protein
LTHTKLVSTDQVLRSSTPSFKLEKVGFFLIFYIKTNNLRSGLDFSGDRSLGALAHGKFNTLTFLQRAEAFTLDRREVHEDIRSRVADKKAKSLRRVEPLDSAHFTFSGRG